MEHTLALRLLEPGHHLSVGYCYRCKRITACIDRLLSKCSECKAFVENPTLLVSEGPMQYPPPWHVPTDPLRGVVEVSAQGAPFVVVPAGRGDGPGETLRFRVYRAERGATPDYWCWFDVDPVRHLLRPDPAAGLLVLEHVVNAWLVALGIG